AIVELYGLKRRRKDVVRREKLDAGRVLDLKSFDYRKKTLFHIFLQKLWRLPELGHHEAAFVERRQVHLQTRRNFAFPVDAVPKVLIFFRGNAVELEHP